MLYIAATGANYGSCGGHYINRWPHGEMAMCVASSIVADQETLDQIRLENSEFYGDQLSEEEDHHSTTTTNDSDDEELSLSDDEASTRHEINSMSVPSGSSAAAESGSFGEEEAQIASEFEKGCGCGDACYEQFTISEVNDFRLNMMELGKSERDMFVIGKLHLLIRNPTHARSSKAAKKQRLTTTYAFDHRTVCQGAFCFLHCLGNFTLHALRKHIMEFGPVPREHGSKGRKAYNAYPFEVVSGAMEFIRNYACVFGLPQPATPRDRANQAPTYLPAHQNHKIVHLKYQEACTEKGKLYAVSKFY